MKQALYIIGGAIIGGFLAYLLLGEVANWYGPRYIKSDEDINKVYLLFLGIVAAFIVVGGACGRLLFQNLTFRSNRRPNDRR
jgi:MFS family permease